MKDRWIGWIHGHNISIFDRYVNIYVYIYTCYNHYWYASLKNISNKEIFLFCCIHVMIIMFYCMYLCLLIGRCIFVYTTPYTYPYIYPCLHFRQSSTQNTWWFNLLWLWLVYLFIRMFSYHEVNFHSRFCHVSTLTTTTTISHHHIRTHVGTDISHYITWLGVFSQFFSFYLLKNEENNKDHWSLFIYPS